MFSKYSKLNTTTAKSTTQQQHPSSSSSSFSNNNNNNEIILQNEKRILKREDSISTFTFLNSRRVFVSKEGIPHVISIKKDDDESLQLYNTKTFELISIPFDSSDSSFVDVNTTTGEILVIQSQSQSLLKIYSFDGVEKYSVELPSIITSSVCPFRDGFLLLSKQDGLNSNFSIYFLNSRNLLKKVYHCKKFISILFSNNTSSNNTFSNVVVMKSWNDDSVFILKENGIVIEYYKYNQNTELLQHIKDISITEGRDCGVVSDFVIVVNSTTEDKEEDFSLIVLCSNGKMYRVYNNNNDSSSVSVINDGNSVKVLNGKLCTSIVVGDNHQLVSVYSTKEISTFILTQKDKLELYDVIRIIGISSVVSLSKEHLYYILSDSGIDGEAVLYSLEYYPYITASSKDLTALNQNTEDTDDHEEIDRILDLVAFSTQNVSVLLRQHKSNEKGFNLKLKASLCRVLEKLYRFSTKEDVLDVLKEKSEMLQRLLDYLERNQITDKSVYEDCFKFSVRLLAGRELFRYYTVNSEFVESLVLKRLLVMELEQKSFGLVKVFFQLYLDRIEELVELYYNDQINTATGQDEESLLRLVELCLCCYYPYLSVGNVSVSANSVELLRNVYDCALSVLDGEYLVKMSELLVYFMHNYSTEDSSTENNDNNNNDDDDDDDDYKSVVVSVIKNLSQYNNILAIQLCERYKLLYGLVALSEATSSSSSNQSSMLFDLCTEYGKEFVKCLVEEYMAQRRLKELMDILFMEELQREFKLQEYAATLSQELKWLILLRRKEYKKGLDVMMQHSSNEKDIGVLKKIVALAAVESQQMMEEQLQEYMVL
ncbi:hypothetical protein MP638_002699 [Amoeboaphelidium occidentale]|nr:hypothetical protein MP638_002699 [Amoeboaphelidium occidentale]